jgi:hypothetical protein
VTFQASENSAAAVCNTGLKGEMGSPEFTALRMHHSPQVPVLLGPLKAEGLPLARSSITRGLSRSLTSACTDVLGEH